MESVAPIRFPLATNAAEDVALNEVDVAIAMVRAGAAVRVRLAGIGIAIAEDVAGIAAARAAEAGVRFAVERSPGAATFTVGPRG
jgi:hypothetical protein